MSCVNLQHKTGLVTAIRRMPVRHKLSLQFVYTSPADYENTNRSTIQYTLPDRGETVIIVIVFH